MFSRIFNSPTQKLLANALDGSELRNRVTANNIANANTPDFKRSEVLFEEQLRQLVVDQKQPTPLRVTNPRHIQVARNPKEFRPEVYELNDLSYRNDGNNVDIEVETSTMIKNSLYYNAVSSSMTQEIRLLRMAITGRS